MRTDKGFEYVTGDLLNRRIAATDQAWMKEWVIALYPDGSSIVGAIKCA